VNITLPVMASLAQSIECDPRLLMLPAVLAASCGFMLPVATAPNAIAFGTGRISARQMLWAGLWLDLVCVLAIVLFVFVIGVPALGVSLHGLPDWARPAP
jgi:sodium-dependent dicarboxylate transporter 2/3/5